MNGQLRDRTPTQVPGLPAEGLRERKKRLMRQQLSDTATAMFLERGFDGVRVAGSPRRAECRRRRSLTTSR